MVKISEAGPSLASIYFSQFTVYSFSRFSRLNVKLIF